MREIVGKERGLRKITRICCAVVGEEKLIEQFEVIVYVDHFVTDSIGVWILFYLRFLP